MSSVPIGTAFIFIRPEVEAFAADLRAGISAQLAEASAGDLSGFDSLANAGQRAFSIIGTAALAAGVVVLKLADTQDVAAARLTNAFTQTGQSLANYQGQLTSTEKAGEKLGLTHAKVEDGLSRLETAVADPQRAFTGFALAENLAAARGVDLNAAVDIVAKTMAGGGQRAVRSLGIDLADLGVNTRDTDAVIRVLSARFAGEAQANAETFGGKVRALSAYLQDQGAAIGNDLIPVLESWAHTGAGVIDYLARHKAAVEALAGVVGGALTVAMGAFILKEVTLIGTGAVNFVTSLGSAFAGMVGRISASAAASEADAGAKATDTAATVTLDAAVTALADAVDRLTLSLGGEDVALAATSKNAEAAMGWLAGLGTAEEKVAADATLAEGATGGFLAGLGGVVATAGSVVAAFTALAVVTGGIGISLSGQSKTVKQLTADYESQARATGSIADAHTLLHQKLDQVSASLVDAKAKADKYAGSDTQGEWIGNVHKLTDEQTALNLALKGIDAAFDETATQAQNWSDELKNLSHDTGRSREDVQALADALGINLATGGEVAYDKVLKASAEIDAESASAQKAVDANLILADAFSTAAQRAAAFGDVLDSLIGAQVKTSEAQVATADAVQKFLQVEGVANQLTTASAGASNKAANEANKLADATTRIKDAQFKLTDEQARVNDVRNHGAIYSAQLATAEASLAGSENQVLSAQLNLATVQQHINEVRSNSGTFLEDEKKATLDLQSAQLGLLDATTTLTNAQLALRQVNSITQSEINTLSEAQGNIKLAHELANIQQGDAGQNAAALALAQENVTKAQIGQQQAAFGVVDAQAKLNALQAEAIPGTLQYQQDSLALVDAQTQLESAQAGVTDSQQKLNDLRAEAIPGTEQYEKDTLALMNAQQALASAQNSAATAATSLGAAAQATGGRIGDLSTVAGRDATSAFDQMASHAKDAALAIFEQYGPGSQTDNAISFIEGAFEQTLTKAGYTHDQIQAILTQYGLLPTQIKTYIQADASQAESAIVQMLRDLAAFAPASYTAQAKAQFAQANLPDPGFFVAARAGGGPVISGTPYIVGENGPELFVSGSNGFVYPNDTLRPAVVPPGGAPGGISVSVMVAPVLNGVDLSQSGPLTAIIRGAVSDGVAQGLEETLGAAGQTGGVGV